MLIEKLAVRIICPHIKLKVDSSDITCFEFETNTIFIGYDINDYDSFMNHIKYIHNCQIADKYSPILWTYLHEVGHYKTRKKFTLKEKKRFYIKDDFYDLVFDTKERDEFLFNVAGEWEATEWAINYLKKYKMKGKFLNWLVEKI